ncbi:MAG: hypothetical protein KKA19_04825 [Candidatus Margulisbacteria bacterium]|nr:hypothetical protein [Candidatus Margulisiibacteriota bacterium]
MKLCMKVMAIPIDRGRISQGENIKTSSSIPLKTTKISETKKIPISDAAKKIIEYLKFSTMSIINKKSKIFESDIVFFTFFFGSMLGVFIESLFGAGLVNILGITAISALCYTLFTSTHDFYNRIKTKIMFIQMINHARKMITNNKISKDDIHIISNSVINCFEFKEINYKTRSKLFIDLIKHENCSEEIAIMIIKGFINPKKIIDVPEIGHKENIRYEERWGSPYIYLGTDELYDWIVDKPAIFHYVFSYTKRKIVLKSIGSKTESFQQKLLSLLMITEPELAKAIKDILNYKM